MFTKEEAKESRLAFWKGFKRYCGKHRVDRRWVLTGVKIPSTQLKFHAGQEKALVLFQIDHRNPLRRYEVYEVFLAYQNLFAATGGDALKWEEEYDGIGGHRVSAIYFELPAVSIYHPEEWEHIYAFFVEKMPLLEELYFEYREVIHGVLSTRE